MEADARRLLRELDLPESCIARPVTQLSVGQQQRVAVARALIGRPEIVIADEPTSALDAQRQERFLDLLLAECAASGASLVFVSHDRRLATHFTREVALHGINRAAAVDEEVAA
jgi:putative ABC transport system ATP-binding protein